MEVKIQIPDNCELIKDGDTYIVREKNSKPKSWEEFCSRYPLHENEVYLDENGHIILNIVLVGKKRKAPNWIVNEQEAEAFLALMQLRQLRKVWIEDCEDVDKNAYSIYVEKGGRLEVSRFGINRVLSFPTQLMAYDFLGCFKDLCEKAKILL